MSYLFLIILILNIINVYPFCKINYLKQKIPDYYIPDWVYKEVFEFNKKSNYITYKKNRNKSKK